MAVSGTMYDIRIGISGGGKVIREVRPMTIISSNKGEYEIKPVGLVAKYTIYQAGLDHMLLDSSCNGMHIITAEKSKVKQYQKELDDWFKASCERKIKALEEALKLVGTKWETAKKNAPRMDRE